MQIYSDIVVNFVLSISGLILKMFYENQGNFF